MLKFLVQQGKEFTKIMKRGNIGVYAASAAYFLILSLVPIAILIVAVIPYTNITLEALIDFLGNFLPEYIVNLCGDIIYEFNGSRIALISVSAIVTLWASGKGVSALMAGLNAVNDVEEKRNFFLIRLISCFHIILMIAMMLLTLVIVVYGNKLNSVIISIFPGFQYFYAFILNFRFALFWIGYAVLFLLIYTIMPSKKMKFKKQLPGALFASISWSLFSWAFSIYVDIYNGFSNYGSLTALIIAMFWLYFCMYIILLGAIINIQWSEIAEFNSNRREEKKRKASEKSANKNLTDKQLTNKKLTDKQFEDEDCNNQSETGQFQNVSLENGQSEETSN